jgi:hypothetical protein
VLDAGIPVHTVAQPIGDDPAILLRNYAKRTRTKKADESLSNAIEAFAAGFLGSMTCYAPSSPRTNTGLCQANG